MTKNGVLKLILCDIGNTTYHFCNTTNGKDFKVLLSDKLPKALDSRIYYISVNKKAAKKLIKNFPDAIDLKDHIKFNTKYQGMGIDRILACSYINDGIIVDAGSAITVDIMDNGIHKGGYILPGLNSLKKAYPLISKKLKFTFNSDVKLNKIPLKTEDAISYAIMQSIILPIKNIAKKRNIIFTGGDGKFLSQYFKNSKFKKDLIFKSMKKAVNAAKNKKIG